KKNALRQKRSQRNPIQVRGGKDAARLNTILSNKSMRSNKKMSKGKMVGRCGERAEGRKRYGITPEAERRTARFPRLEGRNPIRAAAARKKTLDGTETTSGPS